MTTNVQGTRPSSRPNDEPVTVATPNGPVVASTEVGGVAVYDRDGSATTNPSLRPSATMVEDRAPMDTRSSGSMLTWIISAVVLILIVYFLLQWIF
jgi:hypothetical protein